MLKHTSFFKMATPSFKLLTSLTALPQTFVSRRPILSLCPLFIDNLWVPVPALPSVGWPFYLTEYLAKHYPGLFSPARQYMDFIELEPSVISPLFDRSSVAFPALGRVFISFLPELTLAFMIVYTLGVVAVELSANRSPKTLSIECWRAACLALTFVSLMYFIQLLGLTYSGPAIHEYLYISSGLTASKLFVAVTSLFVLHMSSTYVREHARHILEFSIVILIGVLLLLILVSANNLMLLFLSLAGFSLNLYILVLYDGADAASREASLKYFYLSTLSAGMILFGVLLIYTTVGDVTYHAIRFYMDSSEDMHARTVTSAAVLFILLGFFFKLSAFPGHLWAVEVYEGSPLPVMAFFILPVKVAVFITFLRLLNTGLLNFSHIWLPCVTLSAIGSLLWGALAATQARKTTRFLGYASINQIGFLLLGLIVDTDDALRSAIFYLVLYAIMTGGFLLVFTHLRKANGQTLTALSDFRGLGKAENVVCWNLSVFLFSMAGIPPLAGFLGKYYLLASIMERGLFLPAIVALAVSLVTAYYYLRIIKTFWFEEEIASVSPTLLLSGAQRATLSFLEAALWAGAIFAPWLLPALNEVAATLTLCGDSSALVATLFSCDTLNLSFFTTLNCLCLCTFTAFYDIKRAGRRSISAITSQLYRNFSTMPGPSDYALEAAAKKIFVILASVQVYSEDKRHQIGLIISGVYPKLSQADCLAAARGSVRADLLRVGSPRVPVVVKVLQALDPDAVLAAFHTVPIFWFLEATAPLFGFTLLVLYFCAAIFSLLCVPVRVMTCRWPTFKITQKLASSPKKKSKTITDLTLIPDKRKINLFDKLRGVIPSHSVVLLMELDSCAYIFRKLNQFYWFALYWVGYFLGWLRWVVQKWRR